MITLIATMSKNGMICNDRNEIPWVIKDDLTRLSRETKDSVVLLGRKTWDSLGARPMKGRLTAVVTRRKKNARIKGVRYFKTTADALRFYSDSDIVVLGGSSIFADTIAKADRMLLTEVNDYVSKGVQFPHFDVREWHVCDTLKDIEENGLEYTQREYISNA